MAKTEGSPIFCIIVYKFMSASPNYFNPQGSFEKNCRVADIFVSRLTPPPGVVKWSKLRKVCGKKVSQDTKFRHFYIFLCFFLGGGQKEKERSEMYDFETIFFLENTFNI